MRSEIPSDVTLILIINFNLFKKTKNARQEKKKNFRMLSEDRRDDKNFNVCTDGVRKKKGCDVIV